MPTREFSKPTIRENRRTDDSLAWREQGCAALTMVMLYRVTDPADAGFAQADPEFTFSTPPFDQPLCFSLPLRGGQP